MFQAAFGMALERRFGAPVRFLDFSAEARRPRDWRLSVFALAPEPVGLPQRALAAARIVATRQLRKRGLRVGAGILLEPRRASDVLGGLEAPPRLVSGFWQSELYFGRAAAAVRATFVFPEHGHAAPESGDGAEGPVVAVHVRRGDYVSDEVTRRRHLVCDAAWYSRAWAHIRERVGPCRALVFSDDEPWVRRTLRLEGPVAFAGGVAGRPDWVDLARMAECDHFVISNSSYSWWAAYLSRATNKVVVAPHLWFPGVETAWLRVCPPDWTLLP